jgi:hypothetical protein
LSKSAQATLLQTLGIDTPRSITFNDVGALRAYEREISWPALLKPDQGGSGARIQVVESLDEVEAIFAADPTVWLPDNLFLLQEFLPHDPDQGIVRLEFLGGQLLYAMRVKTHGRFNLCPSPVCNPDEGEGICEFRRSGGAPSSSIPSRSARGGRSHGGDHRAGGARRVDRIPGDTGRTARSTTSTPIPIWPSVAAAFGFDP